MRVVSNRVMRMSVILGCVAALATKAAETTGVYPGPCALEADVDRGTVYIARTGTRDVLEWSLEKEAVQHTLELAADPGGLALSPDGTRLYVTAAEPEGAVLVIDRASRKVTWRIPVGHTPTDLALVPDGRTLFVCNRFSDAVSVVDLVAGRETGRIGVSREPVALALTPDGKTLLVANHLPVGPANGDAVAAEVTVIDVQTRRVSASIPLFNGSVALQDIVVSHDGRFAYVPHILARYQVPTTQLDRGWMNSNALTILDVAGRKVLNTVLLDDVDYGAANPWAAAISPDDAWLCVTTAGTDEIQIIDRRALHHRLEQAAAGRRVTEVITCAEDVRNDTTFLHGIKRRVRLGGKGPRSVAVVGQRALVGEFFSDTVSQVKLALEGNPRVRSFTLGPRTEPDLVRRGEQLFHDATICYQQWQSCASCHPGEGRVDALNWDLLNDGLSNPKNTKNLLLAPKTPPSMAMGVRANSRVAVRAGIRHSLMAVRPPEDAEALDAYLESLEPVPSPRLVNGELDERAFRGKRVFMRSGCVTCHTLGLFTDQKSYDVGTGVGMDEGRRFDTPTLIEIWRTAPYLHDGRAATVKEIFTHHNPDDKHGHTSALTPRELDDLEAFLLSL